jgi:hypothetical protein
MKNKKYTYFLGLVVLVVWGVIIYRIFDAASGGDDAHVLVAPAPVQKERYNDFAVAKDTTRLLLNYRDPFGLVKQKDTTHTTIKKPTHQPIPAPAKPAFNWNFIQYDGYILNPVSKKMITLLTINGRNEMMSEGEVKYQVKLMKNLRDSIKISFNGDTKFIILRHVQ